MVPREGDGVAYITAAFEQIGRGLSLIKEIQAWYHYINRPCRRWEMIPDIGGVGVATSNSGGKRRIPGCWMRKISNVLRMRLMMETTRLKKKMQWARRCC
ncbi:hypothetical protein PIB30_042221 [Stylosanthes scabra]|uniref:Uncharacterized protein n=1 Tax=Stylosanthes scabra TaxID=79078 RepID=A0ABU6XFH2_9FABA|nr:hypothetical protein [Stylosanthes scabra]